MNCEKIMIPTAIVISYAAGLTIFFRVILTKAQWIHSVARFYTTFYRVYLLLETALLLPIINIKINTI